jgi:hypothetical protein
MYINSLFNGGRREKDKRMKVCEARRSERNSFPLNVGGFLVIIQYNKLDFWEKRIYFKNVRIKF